MATNFPPSFFSWADGSTANGGTLTPGNAVRIAGSLINPNVIEEYPDSPQIEFAEQGTIRHRFKTSYTYAISLANGLGRGTLLEDQFGNFSRILSCSIDKTRGGDFADLTVIAESLAGIDTPPDDFSIEPIEFSPALEKTPRYFVFDPTQDPPYLGLTPFDIYLVRSAIEGSTFVSQQSFSNLVALIPNPSDPNTSQASDDQRRNGASELLSKLLLGIEAPYISAFRVSWSRYYFYGSSDFPGPLTLTLNPGGFIQDPTGYPVDDSVIPPQFWSSSGSGSNITNLLLPSTLGGQMDVSQCPQYYQRGISWLREADSIFYQRTWFRFTSTWIGAPIGHWDADIYSIDDSPYVVNE